MQGESLPQFPFAKRGRMSRFAKGCIALSDAEGLTVAPLPAILKKKRSDGRCRLSLECRSCPISLDALTISVTQSVRRTLWQRNVMPIGNNIRRMRENINAATHPTMRDENLSLPFRMNGTAPSPSPQQPKPTLNVPRLTSLYQDCIRKVGIYDYIQRHHIDTTAMEAYEKAQKVLDEYSAAAHGYHVLDDQYQSMHNPIKKLKMRPAIKEAAERLGSAAKKLSSTFGISLIIDGEEFDSSVATRNETSALRMRTTERMQRLSEAASEERRQNEEIKSMKLQNIDKESYNKAIVALQRECEDISIAESKAALRALQAAEIPILSFETGDTRSGAKMAVYDFAERILKKKISQAENEAEISPKKVIEAKKEEPEQETYRPTYGRSR